MLSGSGVVSQPALDVYRTALGTKDCSKPLGVLYVLTRSGATATLRAILVDSRGLRPGLLEEASSPLPHAFGGGARECAPDGSRAFAAWYDGAWPPRRSGWTTPRSPSSLPSCRASKIAAEEATRS
jgi:hypothetical protein